MSNLGLEHRSCAAIASADLKRLAALAIGDREAYFKARPDWARFYKRRVLAIALCQGAAQHYLDGITGINDFDVYTFYEANPGRSWYARRKKAVDFGDPKFGRSKDRPAFIGRRVDLFGRAITRKRDETVDAAIRRWLKAGKRGTTAWYLAKKAIVLLSPNPRTVVWPGRLEPR